MTGQGFKPSQVVLRAPIPLTGCFGRAENEVAAALILLALTSDDRDEWRPVSLPEISAALRRAVDNDLEPFATIMRNPFVPPPDFGALVRADAAARTADDRLLFTELGRERMRPWVLGGGS